jgi:peptidoglycan/LPS O-acetylase OafA/YrhL
MVACESERRRVVRGPDQDHRLREQLEHEGMMSARHIHSLRPPSLSTRANAQALISAPACEQTRKPLFSMKFRTYARLEALSPLRFLAAFLVVITHTTFYVKERVDGGFHVWHFGEIGVPIFFVISGVVMIWTGVNTPLNSSGAVDFIIKRLIRIIPLYWLATGIKISATLVSPSLINHNHFELSYAITSLFFIPAFNGAGEVRPIHGVGWTLLHEMFFYTLFSASLFLRTKPVISLGITIPLLTLLGYLYPQSSPIGQVVTSTYNLYFVLGMLVGWTISERNDRRYVAAAALALIGVVQWLIAVELLASSVLIVAAAILVTATLPRLSWLQPAARLGDSSYALYLFHPFIAPAAVVLLAKFASAHTFFIIGTTVAATVFICHLLHLTIETRLTRYAKIFFNGLPIKQQAQ